MSVVVRAAGLALGYDNVEVLSGIELEVGAGEVVLLLGRNGAGKTTLLKAVAGLLPPMSGTLEVLGAPSRPLHRLSRDGLAYVPDHRGVLQQLTVQQNLELAGRSAATRALAVAPELAALRTRLAGLLSGGEQQMLATARAIARRPRLVVADEPSFGLAPRVVRRVLLALRAIADQGASVLLAEQFVVAGLDIADRGYVLDGGGIALTGSAADLRARRADLERVYVSARR